MTKRNDNHIMISFQLESREAVHNIKKSLEKSGYRVWMGTDEAKIFENMAEGVNNAILIIIAMTAKYQKSVNCIRELQYSQEKRKKIVPIKLESNFKPSGTLGLIVAGARYVDFSDTAKFEENISNLKELIESALGKIGKNKNNNPK